MSSKTARGRLFLAASVATAVLIQAAPALADRTTDADQNARIARLEAAVQALGDQLALRNQTNSQEVARNAELTQQVADLQAQVEDLHQSTAAQINDVRTNAAANTVTLANGRPTFATGDGQFTAALRGVVQMDAAIYSQDGAGSLASDPRRGSFGDTAAGGENDHARDLNDGTNLRRARIGIEGRAFGNFEYNFLYDFGGSGVEDPGKVSAAWLQWNASPTFHIRAGAFSPPAGLEEVASTNGSLFAERAGPSELVRSIAAGDGRSAVGVFGNGDNWEYSVALSGGVVATGTFDEQAAVVSRFSFVPYRRDNSFIHLGVNSSYVIRPAATGPDIAPAGATTPIRLRDRPELRVDSTRLIDTGNIDADHLLSVGGEFAWQYSNFYAQAEYFDIRLQRRNSTLADPHFNGWYVQGAWTITGEPRRYTVATGAFDSPRPAHPFSLSQHGWGAWELGLRYSDLDLNFDEGAPGTAPFADTVRGGEQQIFTVGLNWYLNNNVKLMAAFQSVSVDRLSPGGTTFGSYVAGATPTAGTQVGQDLQIWSLRTQYAF